MPLWNNTRNNYQNNNGNNAVPPPNYGYGPNNYSVGGQNGNSFRNGFVNNNNGRQPNNNGYPQGRPQRGYNNHMNMQPNYQNQPLMNNRPMQSMPQQTAPQLQLHPMPQQTAPQLQPQPMPQQTAPQLQPQPMPRQQFPVQGNVAAVMPQGNQVNQNYSIDPIMHNGGQEQTQGPVSYEPLDEKTMEEVRRIIAEKNAGAPLPAQETPVMPKQAELLLPPPVSEHKAEVVQDNALVEFIQNERNASEFYKYLSGIAPKDEHVSTLKTLSNESIKRSEAFNQLHKSIYGSEYAAKKAKVNTTVRFKEGIAWAINVENRALREISDYYDRLENERHLHKLNSIIHKKICDLSYLQSISNNTRSIFS